MFSAKNIIKNVLPVGIHTSVHFSDIKNEISEPTCAAYEGLSSPVMSLNCTYIFLKPSISMIHKAKGFQQFDLYFKQKG